MRELNIIEVESVCGAGIVGDLYGKVMDIFTKGVNTIANFPFNAIAYIPRMIGNFYVNTQEKIVSTVTNWITGAIDKTIGVIVGKIDGFLPF